MGDGGVCWRSDCHAGVMSVGLRARARRGRRRCGAPPRCAQCKLRNGAKSAGEGFAARACRWAAGQRRRCKGAGRRALSSPAVQRAARETRFPRSTERPDRGFWASARRCVARRDAEPGTWLPDLLQLWCAVSNASRPPARPAFPRAAPSPPFILPRTPPSLSTYACSPCRYTVYVCRTLKNVFSSYRMCSLL